MNLYNMKARKIGKTIDEIEEGDSLSLTESIEDNQILLYLGLTMMRILCTSNTTTQKKLNMSNRLYHQ